MPTFGAAWSQQDLQQKQQKIQDHVSEYILTPEECFLKVVPDEPEPIPALGVPRPVVLLITPRPAERPRFSRFGGAYNSKNYSDYKQRLVEALKAKIFEGEILLPADYAGLTADFYLPIPKSWTKKAKAAAAGQVHRSKPDADNYLKALSDALEEAGVFTNDGQVAQMVTRKYYVLLDGAPRIELRLQTLNELTGNV